MDIQHFGHKKHRLRLIYFGEDVEAPLCSCCKYLIRGHAYTCRDCDFSLHKACAELPMEIDSFHPHKLSLYPRLPHSYFICNACEDLNMAFVYHCVICNFSLDVKCAASKDGQHSSERFKAKDKVKKISGHRHPLARCNIRKELEIICVACQQLISDDLAYFHVFLSNYQIFLHESCMHIPEAVHSHPFHQQHPLHRVLLVNGTDRTCKACWMPIQGVGFECKLCQFILHVSCAYYRGRPLKHACHEHDLFHFNAIKGPKSARPSCFSCNKSCTSSFYRCYRCDVNFHLECMPLLPKIKCEVHEHPLVLSASLAEEESVNCNTCGEKRDAEQEVYACEKCPYVAHIECVASGVKHFSHEHALCFTEVIDREKTPCCSACSHLIVDGPASVCLCCNFWQHKSCMDLPPEKQHPYHSEHSLTLCLRPPNYDSTDFVCDGCGDLIRGFTFHCKWCSFDLDVICALQQGVQPDVQRKGIKATLKHFCHDQHSLIRCNIRKELEINCVSCLETISGQAYACYMCKFYIDLSCLNIPLHAKSLYHEHTLFPRAMGPESLATCNACLTPVEGFAFWCEECEFNLHVSCINAPTRALKHDCHKHGLYYFAATKRARSVKCMVCDTSCNDSFFRCVECDFNIHLRCVPLPPTTKHKSHEHPLHFLEHVEEYYCVICETKERREHEVYACSKDCSYMAHIECALSSSEAVPVQHFSHEHALYSTEVIDRDNAPCCDGCSHLINDPAAFFCSICKFWLHKSCMQLQLHSEIQHPYHPQHNLTLHPKPPYYDSKDFICDGCGDLIRGFTFHCKWCRFYLDVKCASQQGVQLAQQRKGINTTSISFCHEHTLIGCYLRTELGIYCVCCLQTISGFAYACCLCEFYIHESCLNIPQEAKSLYHEHNLTPRAISPKDQATCNACLVSVTGFGFWCENCNFNLHVPCINDPTRALKHMSHKHDLYYFAATKLPRSAKCKACDMSCDHSFFRCVECDINFHLDCVPLPLTVRHKWHWHSLRLMDSYIEVDYLNDYYCDICETQRNVEHEVYACRDCLYVAHIECVASQEKVHHDWHPHALFFGEVSEDEINFCSGCGLLINGPAYACLECNFWLDKSCFNLRKEIDQHPLHLKYRHLLCLKWSADRFLLCACGYLSKGLYYECSSCDFILDVICSSPNNPQSFHGSSSGALLEIYILSESSVEMFFFKSCSVRYGSLRADPYRKRRKELVATCEACENQIRGPAYAAIAGQIFFHEQCVSNDLWHRIEFPFHSQRRLLLGAIRRDKLVRCNLCRMEINDAVALFCGEYCNLRFHRSCVNYETRALRHNCHEHDLLYFGPKNVNKSSRFCHSCGEECSGSFLGCIDCKFDIHLECVPLPRDVKHSRHLHPLKFVDVVGNDSGEYRCNMCEGKRNPEHQVYACEECHYIAHIDCVNSVDQPPEEIISYLERQSRQLTSNSDQAKAIGQLDMTGEENDTGSPNLDDSLVKIFEELTARLKVLQLEHSRSTMGRKLFEEDNEQESNVKQECATEDEELVDVNEKMAKIMAKMKEVQTLVTEVEEC